VIEILRGLEESLEEELRLERELLEAGIMKRDGLVSLDLRGVDQASSLEQNILVALVPAGERRLRRTAAAARLLGLSDSESSVTRVAHRAGEPFRPRLLGQAQELREVLRQLARVNATNRALTLQSLAHVRRFFMILGGVEDQVAYTRRGRESRREIPKVMIDKVV
jgi:hypothetical protein